MTELSEAMGNLDIEPDFYSPDSTEGSSSSLSDVTSKTNQKMGSTAYQRLKLNEFLCSSGKVPVRSASKKGWGQLSVRTKSSRVSQAKDAVVASMQVISPDDPGMLWEALKISKTVEKALKLDEHYFDTKYLNALADAYDHASSWDTRRQVLSVMADLVPYHVIQQYIHGMWEYILSLLRYYYVTEYDIQLCNSCK